MLELMISQSEIQVFELAKDDDDDDDELISWLSKQI